MPFFKFSILNTEVVVAMLLWTWAQGTIGLLLQRHPFLRRPRMTMHGAAEHFSLASVRQSLIRQEETIIFALIERAQFHRNEAIYKVCFTMILAYSGNRRKIITLLIFCRNYFEKPGIHSWNTSTVDPWLVEDGSFLSFMLFETEKVRILSNPLHKCRMTFHASVFVLSNNKVHMRARRYTSPEEHAFFPQHLHGAVETVLPEIDYPPVLIPQVINEFGNKCHGNGS